MPIGIALALYPAWVRASSGGLFAPMLWAVECGVAAVLVGIGLGAAKGRWAAFERRLFRSVVGGFCLCYALLIVVGFDWTGDWLRFASFRAGLRTERIVPGAGPAGWRVYEWRSWRLAGLENAAYLVFDPENRLAALPDSGVLPGVACSIAKSRTMVLPWHLIVTENCVLTLPSAVGRKLDV